MFISCIVMLLHADMYRLNWRAHLQLMRPVQTNTTYLQPAIISISRQTCICTKSNSHSISMYIDWYGSITGRSKVCLMRSIPPDSLAVVVPCSTLTSRFAVQRLRQFASCSVAPFYSVRSSIATQACGVMHTHPASVQTLPLYHAMQLQPPEVHVGPPRQPITSLVQCFGKQAVVLGRAK